MSQLPSFRYNPDALSLGIIKKESTHCPVCDQQREYVYEGPFFAEEEVEGICPWCIHDGSAAEKFKGEFQDAAWQKTAACKGIYFNVCIAGSTGYAQTPISLKVSWFNGYYISKAFWGK